MKLSRFLTFLALLSTTVSCGKSPTPSESPEGSLGNMTARVVWLQDRGDNRDVFAKGNRLMLMAYDSTKPGKEIELLKEPGPYAKPLLSPDGNYVVYTHREKGEIRVKPWKKGKVRTLTTGMAMDVWQDPANGRQWVVFGRSPTPKQKAFREMYRIPLDGNGTEEVLLKGLAVSADQFQVSADGKTASGLFPWPNSGIVNLQTGTFERKARGCWTSSAPLKETIFWTFDGAHRNLEIQHPDSGNQWQVSLMSAPNAMGMEMYHPRWSHHPRYFAMTGPYVNKQGGNNIRGGGEKVEILIGRFSEDLREVEAWTQVTQNDRADFYPDLWVADAGSATVQLPAVKTVKDDAPEQASILVKARLVERSAFPTHEDVAPYPRSLVEAHYEVLEPKEFAEKEILIVRWGLLPKGSTQPSPRTVGGTYSLEIQPWGKGKALEGERLVSMVEAFTLPRYVESDALNVE